VDFLLEMQIGPAVAPPLKIVLMASILRLACRAGGRENVCEGDPVEILALSWMMLAGRLKDEQQAVHRIVWMQRRQYRCGPVLK